MIITILYTVTVAGLVGIIAILLLAILHQDAKNDRHFTNVPSESFRLIVAGEKLIRVLSHLSGGYACEKETGWKVCDQRNPNFRQAQSLTERLFGASFVSWLYPIKKVHQFSVIADKLKPETDRAGIPLKEWIRYEVRVVNKLMFRFPHPLFVSDIELGGDKWKVNLILMLDLQITNPAVVVMTYNGKVLQQVDAAVKSAIIDYCNGYTEPDGTTHSWTYDTFLNENKGRGSVIEKLILALNHNTLGHRDGLEERFGISIQSAWVQDLELSGDQAELVKAAQVKALEEARAEGVIAAAKGAASERVIKAEAAAKEITILAAARREALKTEGVGQAEAYQEIMNSMIKQGINPADARHVLNTYIESGNIAKLGNLTTLILNRGKQKTPVILQP